MLSDIIDISHELIRNFHNTLDNLSVPPASYLLLQSIKVFISEDMTRKKKKKRSKYEKIKNCSMKLVDAFWKNSGIGDSGMCYLSEPRSTSSCGAAVVMQAPVHVGQFHIAGFSCRFSCGTQA